MSRETTPGFDAATRRAEIAIAQERRSMPRTIGEAFAADIPTPVSMAVLQARIQTLETENASLRRHLNRYIEADGDREAARMRAFAAECARNR